MSRSRNPNRDRALQIYIENKGDIKISKLANILNENPKTVSSWKSKDKWNEKIPRVGAPKGNKNAKGSKGNKNAKGAPKGNVNSIKHGLYMSDESFIDKMKDVLPKSLINTMTILNNETPLDKLYRNIIILDSKIANSHKILGVKNKLDHTIIRKKKYLDSNMDDIEEFEIQTAQDKESSYSNAIAQMKTTLNNMIKTYLELVDKHEGLAKEEKLLKIEKLKYEVNGLKIDESEASELTIVVDYGEDDDE